MLCSADSDRTSQVICWVTVMTFSPFDDMDFPLVSRRPVCYAEAQNECLSLKLGAKICLRGERSLAARSCRNRLSVVRKMSRHDGLREPEERINSPNRKVSDIIEQLGTHGGQKSTLALHP